MNKLYSQIASLLVVVGLGTAWAFKLLTFEQLGTGATALLGLIYGLYQKYEKGVVETKSLKLEDELNKEKKFSSETMKIHNILVNKLNKEKQDHLDLKNSISKNEIVVETVQEVIEKPKRKYYKAKKS